MENASNAKYLIRFILWLKSIYDQMPNEVKPYVTQLADATRQRLLDEGVIKDPDHDPIVGKYTSYEKGIQNLGLTPDTDVTPEQKALQALQTMGIDTSPLKLIMPSLFTSNKQTTQTIPQTTPQTTQQTTQQGVSVPTYEKTPTGKVTQTGQLNQSSVSAPAGTVPIRNYLKDVYGLSDDAFQWDNTKGLTIKAGDKEIYLGKPTEQEAIQTFKGNAIRRPDTNDKGQIINGTWYSNPNYVDTIMSINGVKRQKEPIREALPKYLESKGITGATVDWDKNSNQVLLKVGDKTYKLGNPSQIGSVYNGTTYVNQDDLDRVLSPVLKELGQDIANKDFNTQTNDTTTTGNTTQTGDTTTTNDTGTKTGTGNQSIPEGLIPIRNFLKDIYGLTDDSFQWDDIKGLTIKVGDKVFNLGKPTRPEDGIIVNGTWYTSPDFIATAMSLNGIKRQRDPIREALPAYLESKGIKGATVDWDKDSNQIILKVGDKTYKLGTPEQIGKVYNGTTYVSQADIEKALAPIAKDLGLDTGTSNTSNTTSSNTTQDVTQMTTPEIKLNEEINQAGIMNKTYDQLITDIESRENNLLNDIHDTYQKLITDSLTTMENALTDAKKALEGTKGNYDDYEKSAYQEIEKNVEAAKSKSKEEMAARGIYFSGLTTRALNNIEAQGISEKNKVHMQVLQWKAQIDSQIAILTANTKMSEAQLQNELMAREALDKLQLIEKDQDKIEAIKQEKALLDAQIEIDKANLPLENELYRRQQEIQSQKDAMEFMEKIYMPMLRLQYEDKWKQEDLDLAYMKYQQSVMSFFEDVKEFWAKLGFDEEKFKQTFLWDKEKFAEEMGFKQEELETKSEKGTQSGTGTGAEIPTWLQRYLPYLKMQPDKLDAMVEQGYVVDVNGEQRTLTDEDKTNLKALATFLHSLEPKNKSNFLPAFNDLMKTFGEDGAFQILNIVNTDIPEAKILKQLVADYGSLRDFASVYEQANTYGLEDSISKYIQTLEKTLGVDENSIISVFSYVTNLYKGGYGR